MVGGALAGHAPRMVQFAGRVWSIDAIRPGSVVTGARLVHNEGMALR